MDSWTASESEVLDMFKRKRQRTGLSIGVMSRRLWPESGQAAEWARAGKAPSYCTTLSLSSDLSARALRCMLQSSLPLSGFKMRSKRRIHTGAGNTEDLRIIVLNKLICANGTCRPMWKKHLWSFMSKVKNNLLSLCWIFFFLLKSGKLTVELFSKLSYYLLYLWEDSIFH